MADNVATRKEGMLINLNKTTQFTSTKQKSNKKVVPKRIRLKSHLKMVILW